MPQIFYVFFTLITALFESPQVILITLDGIRWQDIYYGTDCHLDNRYLPARTLTPNLHAYFIDDGIALGKAPVVASGPNFISLPGYLEITRGHPSLDCQTNTCNPVLDQSIFYWFNKSAVFSSWANIGKSLPMISNIYSDIPNKYRLDKDTESKSIYYLNNNVPDLLWVSLGDSDEHAHNNNYNTYIKSLKEADEYIGYISERFKYSLIVVTTDHGRNPNFKDHDGNLRSKRVWIMIRGPGIPNRGIINVSASLSDIYYTIIDYQFGIYNENSILRKIK